MTVHKELSFIMFYKCTIYVQIDYSKSDQSRSEVTAKAVKQACGRMLPGKTDESGVYTSDVFLHAPDSLFEHLAAIFRSYLTHGTVSLQILSCAFLPLF